MNINLDDSTYQEEVKEVKPIFNGGKAGVVRNCTTRISKRGAEENEKAPRYKLWFKDESGAELDDALFDIKEGASEKQISYWGKKMNYLQSQYGFTIANRNASPTEILDQVAKGIHENCTNKKFGVAVGFGKEGYPKSYLEIDGYWDFRNEDEITAEKPLLLRPAILQTRLEPTGKPGTQDSGDWGEAKKEDGDGLPF